MKQTINLLDFINEKNHEVMKEADDMAASDISELHMHKILFILYGKFGTKFKKDLFVPNFQAWKYGPVEMDYRNMNWEKFYNISLTEEEVEYLNRILKKYLIKSNPWLLVEYTHDFSCWSNNYRKENQEIPKEEIIKDFKTDYNFE